MIHSKLSAFLSHRLVVNAFFLMLMRLVTFAAPFLALWHLLAVLGLELYGVVAFGIALIQFAILICDAGLTLAATRKASVLRDSPKFLSRLMGGVIGVKLGLALCISTGILVFAAVSEKYADYQLLLCLLPASIVLLSLHPNWLFLGLEKARILASITITGKLCFLIMLFALVRDPDTYYMAPVADAIGNFVIIILGYGYLRRHGFVPRVPSMRDIWFTFRIGLGFFISRLAIVSYQNTAVVILGLFASPIAVAMFSIADQIYKAIQQVFGPIAQAMYPYMAREKDIRLLGKILIGVVIAVVCIVILVIQIAPYILEFLSVEDVPAVMGVLNILLFALLFQVVSMFTGYPLYTILGRLDVANKSIVFGAGIFFVLMAIYVPLGLINAQSLAWAIVGTEISVLLVRLGFWAKISLNKRRSS